MIDVCIFPIPDCVTFPGTVFPLHVFEPRYREMIQYSLESKVPVAICHPEKQLTQSKPNQSKEEALNSNQATYKPNQIVSAGWCELKETMEDGRMLVLVHIEQRYRLVEEVQLLPYMIYTCEAYQDTSGTDEEAEQNKDLKEQILWRLNVIGGNNPTVEHMIQSDEWQDKTPEAFSFEMFELLRFPAQIQQHILEMKSANERLEFTLELLQEIEI